jgi:CheY-like chemotaxis protein
MKPLRHVLAAVLAEHGYDVTTSGSMPEALKLITAMWRNRFSSLRLIEWDCCRRRCVSHYS